MPYLSNTTARPYNFRYTVGAAKADGSHAGRIRVSPGGPAYAEKVTDAELAMLRKEVKHFRKRELSGEIVELTNDKIAVVAIAERKEEEEKERAKLPENKLEERKRKRQQVAANKDATRKRRVQAAKQDDDATEKKRKKVKKSSSTDEEI